MKTSIIAGNWKMNTSLEEATILAKEISVFSKIENRKIIIIPPYPFLYEVSKIIENTDVALGAQDVFYERKGAFTGEVSCQMLTSIGVKYVLIGHSERRSYHLESNEILCKKMNRALEEGLKIIFCIGETLKERESNQAKEVIKNQIEKVIFGLKESSLNDKLIIAYEPVWAIGTGKTASAEEAEEMHSFIRSIFLKQYQASFVNTLPILYGGSVNGKNIDFLMAQKNINGGLIGGASLKVEEFKRIYHYL